MYITYIGGFSFISLKLNMYYVVYIKILVHQFYRSLKVNIIIKNSKVSTNLMECNVMNISKPCHCLICPVPPVGIL